MTAINIKSLDYERGYLVFLDGKNVTDDCYEADSQLGYVRVYKSKDGKYYLENNEVAKETKYGEVKIYRDCDNTR